MASSEGPFWKPKHKTRVPAPVRPDLRAVSRAARRSRLTTPALPVCEHARTPRVLELRKWPKTASWNYGTNRGALNILASGSHQPRRLAFCVVPDRAGWVVRPGATCLAGARSSSGLPRLAPLAILVALRRRIEGTQPLGSQSCLAVRVALSLKRCVLVQR